MSALAPSWAGSPKTHLGVLSETAHMTANRVSHQNCLGVRKKITAVDLSFFHEIIAWL